MLLSSLFAASASAVPARPASDDPLQCIEAVHLVLFKKADLTDGLIGCSIPRDLPPLLATDYDILLSMEKRRARLGLDLTPDEQAACHKHSLAFYRDFWNKVGDTAPVDPVASPKLQDFMRSVWLEAELTGESARQFFANSADSTLCIDPFFIVAVLRTRNAVIAAMDDMLGAFSEGSLPQSAAETLWLATLHADNHPLLQHKAADIFEKAAKAGRFPGKRAANLVDRLELAEGRPQIYGTLYDCEDGKLRPPSITDPEQIDARRAAIGLTPYATYIKESEAKCLSQ
ncbi:hypothetical protein AQ1_02330 [alpha proteobacterium Q-1]|nr:hypothetical protein AQ1_02330 [alpha proteobacterium Q-1]